MTAAVNRESEIQTVCTSQSPSPQAHAPQWKQFVGTIRTRGHGHAARGHMYQQSMRSTLQSSPFPPTTRRV